MTSAGRPASLDSALQHHQAGRLREAESLYRESLSIQPNNADALHLLGVLLHQSGRNDEALTLIDRAIHVTPNTAVFNNNRGLVLIALQRFDEAEVAYSRAVALQPDYADAIYSLAWLLNQKQKYDEALTAYERLITLRPDYLSAYNNAGNILLYLGRLDEAAAIYRRAIAAKPDYADAYINLGTALSRLGKSDEALAAYQQGANLKPTSSEAFNNLGNALQVVGRAEEAVTAYRRAIELQPNSADAYFNLGQTLLSVGEIDQSIAASEQAVLLNPTLAAAHNNLGNALKAAGQLDEALLPLRRAAELSNEPYAQANLMLSITFHPDFGPQQIYEEHVRWNERYAKPLAPAQPVFHNDPNPHRKLRIGYVSAHFREHCLSLFKMPLLSHHDHSRFEIFCYADVRKPDAVTAQLRSHADCWRDVTGINDAAIAEWVRDDRIDILVDIAMHLEGSHLMAFARKPAPVQVTWLGYPGTTGLTAMDYRFSDPLLDPGFDDAFYSEKTIHLPVSFWCYDPMTSEPAVNELPARSNGFITFGSLNNIAKLTNRTIELWSNVLNALPTARLRLLAPAGSARQRVIQRFALHGIAEHRIEFVPWLPREKYLQEYHHIDIALDPFPYPGHTTTMDALWMGVPVVNLPGSTAAARGGKSILTNVGLPELIATSDADFVRIATTLAHNLESLSELRRTLRTRMESSPLMDGARFARDVESAFTSMWQTWCKSVRT